MNNMLEILFKFTRFLIAVIIGFFLATLKPIFKVLKNKKRKTIFSIINMIMIVTIYYIIRTMTNQE
uniref:Uncharacterized protein ycf33 n=1 Tax=Platysiphonia delicata TaxID=2006979 RepID=A0A1Z1M1K8_9FLOR|nr:hypothetical protein [Platysiphonia delicata]ARW59664.1 hypothetical protein [Platysiphonia delicata]